MIPSVGWYLGDTDDTTSSSFAGGDGVRNLVEKAMRLEQAGILRILMTPPTVWYLQNTVTPTAVFAGGYGVRNLVEQAARLCHV